MKIILMIGLCLILFPSLHSFAAADRADQTAPDPLDATYWIEDKPVTLTDGRCELPAAPGSAITVRTTVWRHPVFGDLDGNGDEDAALLLIHDPGGSGTFYYVAAAINASGRYRGTNTVLLGDRIAPSDISILNREVVVKYANRHPDEPFSETPSLVRTVALALQNGRLLETPSSGDLHNVTQGWVIIGHEVRSFKPCDGQNDLWLMGQSPVLKAIMAAYRRALPEQNDYRPVFMVLVGERVEPPAQGFGADFDGAFLATRLVRVAREASCASQSVYADSPQPVRHKIAFDTSTLDDEGLMGPPGGKQALSYEFCIPDSEARRGEVVGIDPTIRFFSTSPGRIGCKEDETLCVGSTHQKDFKEVLQRLAELPYVQLIDESFFE